jgi:phage protein D
MSISKLSAANDNFYAPRFEIEIKDSKIKTELANSIIDLSVDQKKDEGALFSIKIHDEFDMKDEKFKWLDDDIFSVGNTVKIKMGYGSKLEEMLYGHITGLTPSFFSGEPPTITVSGQDLSYDFLKRKSPADTFTKMTYSDIAQDIAKKAGLTAEVDKTTEKFDVLCKESDVSYFDFLRGLADREGFQVSIEGKKLLFKKPTDDKKEIFTLQLGRDLVRFKPTMDTTQILSEVEVRWHDPKNPSKPIVGTAKAGDERTQEGGRQTGSQVAKKVLKAPKKVITHIKVESVNHAKLIAKAVLNKASDSYIGGEAECVGIPQIQPGVCIELDKMGKRFSGKYYVVAAAHKIGSNGYTTTFTVKRNAA